MSYTTLDWVDEHKGYRKYVAIAGKLLACLPDTVWICTMLCKQPSYRKRYPGFHVRWIYMECSVSSSEPASARMQ